MHHASQNQTKKERRTRKRKHTKQVTVTRGKKSTKRQIWKRALHATISQSAKQDKSLFYFFPPQPIKKASASKTWASNRKRCNHLFTGDSSHSLANPFFLGDNIPCVPWDDEMASALRGVRRDQKWSMVTTETMKQDNDSMTIPLILNRPFVTSFVRNPINCRATSL